ncbi:MAG: hypothetical protein GY679_00165 [Mycoplasma sp.]|nr:hypothetical protein [Mycoplasma sp.]
MNKIANVLDIKNLKYICLILKQSGKNLLYCTMNEYEDSRNRLELLLSITPLDSSGLLMFDFGVFQEEGRIIMPLCQEN